MRRYYYVILGQHARPSAYVGGYTINRVSECYSEENAIESVAYFREAHPDWVFWIDKILRYDE